jgi:serine-type D-Ala-D-Ala carboxypeptidase (penicillin-binding protein 5/6)
MNVKLFLAKTFLQVLMFIDFLEDLPLKAVKFTIKIGFIVLLVFVFSYLISVERQSLAVSKVISYIFIPQSHVSQAGSGYAGYPSLSNRVEFPEISAKAFVIFDSTSNRVLRESNSNIQLPPASTTKVVTAMVAREIYDLDEVVLVPEICTLVNSQKLGFATGDLVRVEDLINSLLIASAGDAACTLAYGSDNYGYFIGLMNKVAYDLGAANTNFANPIGLDDYAYQHYSTAWDLVVISQKAMRDPYISKAVSAKDYTITSTETPLKMFNTNNLLWEIDGSVGIKTGRTAGAGEVLVYKYIKDNKELIIVVMGSEDRFGDTKKLLDWALRSYNFGR